MRIKLALLLQQKINTLIFDEPTNHIDIPTKEMLEEALGEFEGTLIFISHDRYLSTSLHIDLLKLKMARRQFILAVMIFTKSTRNKLFALRKDGKYAKILSKKFEVKCDKRKTYCDRWHHCVWKKFAWYRSCKTLHGEIISADSRQVYRALILAQERSQKRKWQRLSIILLTYLILTSLFLSHTFKNLHMR